MSDLKMAHNYPNGIAVLAFTNAASAEFDAEKPDYCAKDLIACKSILTSLLCPNGLKLKKEYEQSL